MEVRSRRAGYFSPLLILALTAASGGEAQRRGGGRGGFEIRLATPDSFDGLFQFCLSPSAAIVPATAPDGAWPTRADIMSIRLSELTKTKVSFSAPQKPNHLTSDF